MAKCASERVLHEYFYLKYIFGCKGYGYDIDLKYLVHPWIKCWIRIMSPEMNYHCMI